MVRKLGILRGIALIMVIVLLSCVGTVPVTGEETVEDKRAQLAQLKKEQEQIKQTIANLGSDIEAKKVKVQQLYLQVSNVEAQIEWYEGEIKKADADIAKRQTRIDQLNGEIEAKEAEIKAILEQLKKRAKAITQTGNYSSFQILMSTDNYTDFILKAKVLASIAAHDQALREKAVAEKQAIAEARTLVEAEQTAAETKRAELQGLKAELDVQFADIDTLYKTAYAEKQALEKQLGTYEKEQEAIKRAEAELEKEIQDMLNTETAAKYGGKMYWPVPGIKTLSRGYSSGHKALDIWGVGIFKKPIYAAADGVVVRSTWHYSYGNYVMIDHGVDEYGRRIMTLYAHMHTSPYVKVGQQVIGGQTQLGIVGTTGNSTGPHLHFEVRENGVLIDPLAKGYVVKPK